MLRKGSIVRAEVEAVRGSLLKQWRIEDGSPRPERHRMPVENLQIWASTWCLLDATQRPKKEQSQVISDTRPISPTPRGHCRVRRVRHRVCRIAAHPRRLPRLLLHCCIIARSDCSRLVTRHNPPLHQEALHEQQLHKVSQPQRCIEHGAFRA